MRFYLQFVLAIVATLLFSNFAQAASGSQTSSAATISYPPRKNVDVPHGYTVKDNAGNVVVKTEGGATATVYYLSEDRATVDRVNKAKNVVEDFRVVGILFKTDKFNVDQIEAFVGFRQEFAEKVIHETLALNTWRARCCAFRELGQFVGKAFNFR